MNLARWTARRVTRIEVLLSRRPSLREELRSLVAAASQALGEALSLPASSGPSTFRLESDARVARGPRVCCVLHLGGPGVDALLELDVRWVVALVAHLTGAPPPTTPVLGVSPFERAVLGHLLLVVLAGVRAHPSAEARWRPRLVGVAPSRRDAEAGLGRRRLLEVALELRAGTHAGHATLSLCESAVHALILGTDVDPPRATGAAAGTARFPFWPRISGGSLWARQLDGLRPGDAVVLPGQRCVDGRVHGPLALVRRGVLLTGRLSGPGWTLGVIESSEHPSEVTRVDPQLSSLPVELDVELARVPLTLAELSNLAPGSIVPLRVAMGDPVFLCAGDRRVARAELVEVEGEVAARVLDLVEGT